MLSALQVFVQNFSKRNRTTVNKRHVTGVQRLRDGDMIFIADRAFRFEYGESVPLCHRQLTASHARRGVCRRASIQGDEDTRGKF